MACTTCLSLWERWLSNAKTERGYETATPSQSPSVTALPEGEPRGSTPLHSVLVWEMERICTDYAPFIVLRRPIKWARQIRFYTPSTLSSRQSSHRYSPMAIRATGIHSRVKAGHICPRKFPGRPR